VHVGDEMSRHAVAGDRKESDLAARLVDGRGRASTFAGIVPARARPLRPLRRRLDIAAELNETSLSVYAWRSTVSLVVAADGCAPP
jgi:hypothetical protein